MSSSDPNNNSNRKPPVLLWCVNCERGELVMYYLDRDGKVRDATLFLLGMKLKPYETIAELIKKACKGLGTNELLLSCTLIRYQICLKEVMAAYTELYDGSLQDLLESETGGDYRKLLIEMCNVAAA